MASVQPDDFMVVDAHGDSTSVSSVPGELRIDMLLGRKLINCANMVFTDPASVDDLIVLLQAHKGRAWPSSEASTPC